MLLISIRYNYEADNLIINKLKQHNLPYFYWTKDPIEQTKFNFINSCLNLRNIDIRIQLYIKSKAKVNIGSQAGNNHLVVRYSDVYEVQIQFPLAGNYVKGETYLKDKELDVPVYEEKTIHCTGHSRFRKSCPRCLEIVGVK